MEPGRWPDRSTGYEPWSTRGAGHIHDQGFSRQQHRNLYNAHVFIREQMGYAIQQNPSSREWRELLVQRSRDSVEQENVAWVHSETRLHLVACDRRWQHARR